MILVAPVLPPASAPRPARVAARAICQHHAKSFYFASHFLPRAKRDHAYAVYAFCRLLDDAADENPTPGSVDAFQRLLHAVYDNAHAPLTAQMSPRDRLAIDAFAHTVRACSIPRVYFDELAEGCRMDFTIHRYATWKELEHYCYRVAGVVGLMMCRVFGLKDERALEQAVQMGNAMQLTNILRDVAEDWDRGRLYLPARDLAQFGLDESAIAARRCDAAFVSMMRFQIDRARALYAQAAIGLRQLPYDGSRLTACVMAVVYAGILRAIERQDHNVFAGRAHLTTRQKLLRVHKAWQLSRWTGRTAMPDVF